MLFRSLGELCGSVILPVLLLAREQPELMRQLPRGVIASAAAPCAVVAACLLGAAHGLLATPIALLSGALLGVVLYGLQWLAIGHPAREQLRLTLRLGRS